MPSGVPGYPVLPLAFCVVAAAVVLSVVRTDPVSASRGAVLLATGIPGLLLVQPGAPSR